MRMLKEWSDGSGACYTHAWGIVRRVTEGDVRAGGVVPEIRSATIRSHQYDHR
jgi:hypothetical protein